MDAHREVSTVDLASRVRRILDAGLDSVTARACIERGLRERSVGAWFDALDGAPLDGIAVGKAAEGMTRALLDFSGGPGRPRQTVARALVVSPGPPREPATSSGATAVEHLISEHPLPGAGGERASNRVEEWVEAGRDRDLVFLLSGGASSLLPAPSPAFPLRDQVAWTDRLMRAGTDIGQLNTVRSQMSRLKGGRLAARSRYRRVLVLVLSDVVGDDLASIGSGPWFPSAASGAKPVS